MRRTVKWARTALKLLLVCALSVLLAVLRYILRTPQPFDSMLPGEARLYKWRYGHIFYKVMGPADAPPLVLFHAPAIGASGHEMRYIAEQLIQDYRVYVPDLLGFGLSDHPQVDYTANLYVDLCRDFLHDVVQQPAILLGSGLSNHYCVAVAHIAPDLCRRVILMEPMTIFTLSKRPTWLKLLVTNNLAGFVLYASITARPFLYLIANRHHNLDKVSTGSDELHTLFVASHQFGAQYTILALLAGKLDLEVTHLLFHMGPPVQMIWGDRALQALSRFPSMASQTHVDVIDSSGTYPHLEQPMKVVSYIQAYESRRPDTLQDDLIATIQEPPPAVGEHATTNMQQGLAQDVESRAEMIHEGSSEPDGLAVQDNEEVIFNEKTQNEEHEAINVQPVIEAYCFKCKQKRVMQDASSITTKNGRNAMEGMCSVCGTRLFRFIAS